MPTIHLAFARSIVAAAGYNLSDQGDVLDDTRIVAGFGPIADGRMSDRSYYALVQWVRDQSTDQLSLVRAYADAIRPDDLGVLGLALKTAPCFRASLQRLERYSRLLTDTAQYRLVEGGLFARMILGGQDGSHAAQHLRTECALAGLVHNARRFLSGTPQFRHVSFRHARDGDQAGYDAFFGCPVIFGASEDSIAMPLDTLNLPTLLGDPAVSAFLTSHLEEELGPLRDAQSFKGDVLRRLSMALSNGVPQAATLAQEMGLSERTFFRRLAKEGTSFRDVVREAQMSLAEDLLGQSDCSLAEIAFLTGFAEQSTFGRAFKRWAGEAPAQYRSARLDTAHVPPRTAMAGSAKSMAGGADTDRTPAF